MAILRLMPGLKRTPSSTLCSWLAVNVSVDVDLRARRPGYEGPREDVQALVPLTARRILDLGCASGALGAALKERQKATVVGVEIDRRFAADASARLDRVVTADVEAFLAGPIPAEAPFDCLVAADVLEHLVDPWDVLSRASRLMAPGATAVISVPNVTNWYSLWRVIRNGRWPLDDEGPFDRTHLRWFALDDALDLVRGAGLQPVAIDPQYWVHGWWLRLHHLLARTALRRFLAVQYVIAAVKL